MSLQIPLLSPFEKGEVTAKGFFSTLLVLVSMFLLCALVACGKGAAPAAMMRPVTITMTSPTPPQEITPTSNLRNLSEAEKEKAILIALNTTEASAQIEKWNTYKTGLDWVGMLRNASGGWYLYGLDYNVWVKGIPDGVPLSAVIYPRVSLYFGEPQELDSGLLSTYQLKR